MEHEMMHLIQNPPRATSTTGVKSELWQCSSYKSSSCLLSLTPARSLREAEPDDGRRQPAMVSVRRTLPTLIDKPTPRESVGAVRVVFQSEVAPSGRWLVGGRRATNLALLVICLVAFASIGARVLEAKPIKNPVASTNGTENVGGQLGVEFKPQQGTTQPPTTLSRDQTASNSNETSKTISIEALTDLIDRVTSAFTAAKSTEPATATSRVETSPTPTTEKGVNDTESKTNTDITTTTASEDYDSGNDSPGAGNDDHDAEDCQGLPSGAAEPGKGPSDNERLVNLQACLQKKVKKQLMGSARSSMEMFEKLSLSGPCSGSLMNLMSSLGELKGFAFKFLDASAKIPSGMMSGLLSDFGDFEQCLTIRSNPAVDPRLEQEEGGYSGKYCMLNIKLRYHVKLGANSSAPEGIYPDGVLWDELVRNYWTTNSSKGFQVGVCVPSRCDQDDLEQMFKLFAESYHFQGEIGACQDSNDVRRQQEPDTLQWAILSVFLGLSLLNLFGTIVDLYLLKPTSQTAARPQVATCSPLHLVACFSIRRNWLAFLHGHRSPGAVLSKFSYCHQTSAQETSNKSNYNKETRPLVVSDYENSSNGSGSSSSASNTLASSSSFCSSTPEGAINCSIASSQDLKSAPYKRLDHCRRPPMFQPLTIRTSDPDEQTNAASGIVSATTESEPNPLHAPEDPLSHLCGLKLMVTVWITIGHSFLYPSANNYQHYRSIINMAITRTSVWFATTNFILGIDMLLYMTGLMFVYKLANGRGRTLPITESNHNSKHCQQPPPISARIGRLILRKVLRLWPVYLSVIALAIVTPLVSNGPMWPEVVTRRLGETCRRNWWANLLMMNNFLEPSRVCLPSSWFISVAMQCFLVGSLVMMVANWRSIRVATALALLLIVASSSSVFWLAHSNKLNAPAIRMDESFVMELDEQIFKMYTSTLSNLGPFLVGMLGGFVLLWHQTTSLAYRMESEDSEGMEKTTGEKPTKVELISDLMFELNTAFAMLLIAMVVLSSVFLTSYTPFWSAIYWSCHRIGWAVVTGYLIHQSATGKWRLLKQLLSLNSFIPLARLIFLAYLVHPMFIYIHSGLVRDGLHVSLYNMLNIYISRLVMTFSLALALHLLVELPVCNLEERILESWLDRRRLRKRREKWLESGGGRRVPNNKTLYAATPNATDGPKLDSGLRTSAPLLVIASGVPVSGETRNSSTTFVRQHTTESTLSHSSE